MKFLCAECDIYSNGKELVEAFGKVKAGRQDGMEKAVTIIMTKEHWEKIHNQTLRGEQ